MVNSEFRILTFYSLFTIHYWRIELPNVQECDATEA